MMESAHTNMPRVLIARREQSPNFGDSDMLRLNKALASFCEVVEKSFVNTIKTDELNILAETHSHIFIELELFDIKNDLDSKHQNITLIHKDSFPWNSPKSREALMPILSKYPCFIIENTPASELLRILHLYLLPKRNAGVLTLMEKGSLILGEKIQNVENMGELIDKLCFHISQQESEIKNRSYDTRVLIGTMVNEAFLCAKDSSLAYPTVDFQCSANKEKITLNIRFPIGKIKIDELKKTIIDGRDLAWHLSWLCSDCFIITFHEQYNEIEISAIIYQEKKNKIANYRSLLLSKREKSAPAENLLFAPNQYKFSLISELKNKAFNQENVNYIDNTKILQQEYDESLIPESIKEKIKKLENERSILKSYAEKKETRLTETATKLNMANREIVQKRNEMVLLVKSSEGSQDRLKQKIAELEKKISQISQAAEIQQNKENSSESIQSKIISLQQELKISEKEKNQTIEKLSQEQKRIAIYEQKYSNIFKELNNKDVEIKKLKSQLSKLQRDIKLDENGNPIEEITGKKSTSADKELLNKIKDFEARELVLKQELRKLTFKAENQEKNTKAIQNEAAEKIKLLEKKHEQLKNKELEQIKKIEELTNLLKKANKAA